MQHKKQKSRNTKNSKKNKTKEKFWVPMMQFSTAVLRLFCEKDNGSIKMS